MTTLIPAALQLPDKKFHLSLQETLPIPAFTRPFFTGSLPLPPSSNMALKIIRTNGHLRIGATPALIQFKQESALLLACRERVFIDWPLLDALRSAHRHTPLAIRLDAYFATEWKRDLDGMIKYTIDVVFDYLQLNDNLVKKIEAEKLVDSRDPRVEIEVRCITR